jgi:S1-C subfamily serine protease
MRMKALPFLAVTLVLSIASLACSNLLTATGDVSPTEIPKPLTLVTPYDVLSTDNAGSSSAPLEEGDLISLYESVNPGVVTIWTYTDLGATSSDQVLPTGQGSGFVVSEEGYIVTNQHVVNGADEIEVDFPSGLKVWAELVGTDPDSDLAVLNIDLPKEFLTPLPLGDSDQVRVGEFVIAIGNPFGLSGTMTVGIVSAIGRTLFSENPAPGGSFFSAGDIIQTDAAINPGNSGGPLINLRGEVIGVNRAIRTESFTVTGGAANSGVGFAIPSNIVRQVLPAIIEDGRYDYPYLGISSLSDWNLKTIETLGLPNNAQGAYVTCVTPGSPAETAGVIGAGQCGEAGLAPGGDLIIAIDGDPVRQFADLLSHLLKYTQVDQVVTLTVVRNGEQVDLPLTIGARP